MLAGYNVGKVALLYCNLKGQLVGDNTDGRCMVQCIRAFESLCKPYITCQFTIVDSAGWLNVAQPVKGDPISFAYDTGMGIYEQQQYILTISYEEQNDSLRTIVYTIETAGASYFYDRVNTVQGAYTLISGTALASLIHEQFMSDAGLALLGTALGPLALPTIGGFTLNGEHPWSAIMKALNASKFAEASTLSPMYFRDAKKHNIGPLQAFFDQMGSQQEFWQKGTWGYEVDHTWGGGDPPSTNAIIAAGVCVNDQDGGREGGSPGPQAQGTEGSASIFGRAAGKELSEIFGQIGGGSGLGVGAGLMKFIRGQLGGWPINVMMNEDRRPQATDPLQDLVAARAFQGAVKGAVNYYVKVPIQSGVQCTVGKGATIHLTPPTGDLDGGIYNSFNGTGLLADLSHETFFDNRPFQGSTTFRWVNGYGG